jgi:hypothetical protein
MPQELLKRFEDKFSIQDLKKVYFLMGIGFDDLAGSGTSKSVKAIALIDYARMRARLSELLAAMREVNPVY